MVEPLAKDTPISLSKAKWIRPETVRVVFLLMVVVFAIIVYGSSLSNVQVGVSDDDAHYIVAAKALSTGQGYMLINYPEPRNEILWPPGYPLLLAPLTHWYPDQYLALQIASIVLTIIWLLLSFIWFEKVYGTLITSLGLLLIAFNPQVVGIATQVISESLFLVLLFGSFLFLEKGYGKLIKHWPIWLFLAIICAVYATAVRSIGLAILVTIVTVAPILRLWRRMFVAIVLICLLFSPLAFFLVNNGGTIIAPTQVNQGQIAWTSNVVELTSHAISNFQVYAFELLPSVLTAAIGPKVTALAAKNFIVFILVLTIKLVMIGLIVLGFYDSLKLGLAQRRKLNISITLIFALVYLSIILIFRDGNPRGLHAQARYLIPLLPFLIIWMLRGFQTLVNLSELSSLNLKFEHSRLLIIFFSALFLSSFLIRDTLNIVRPNPSQIPDISVGASWINEHTPINAIVACDDPVPRFLYLNRKTVRYPKENSLSDMVPAIKRQADYLLIAPRLRIGNEGRLDPDQVELISFLMNRPDFELIYEDSKRNVFIFGR
jgi:hypothetical protein